MRFIRDGKPCVLNSTRNDDLKKIYRRHIQHSVHHEDMIDWEVNFQVMPTLDSTYKPTSHPKII